jgi:flagellar biosynthetic protein FliR
VDAYGAALARAGHHQPGVDPPCHHGTRVCRGRHRGVGSPVAGVVPAATVPTSMLGLVTATAGEILLGLVLGFVGRVAFAAVEMAGRLIASEIGLSAMPGMGVPEPSTEPVAALLSSFAVVLYFMFGGHELLIGTLARSLYLAPAGRPMLNAMAGESMIESTAHVIELGLRIAAPFIAMNFLVTLAFSALGRAVPKMQVFVLSGSVRLIAGIGLLGGAGALIARYLFTEFGQMPVRMLQLLPIR